MILYIAGPYRGATPEIIKQNIQNAREVAVVVWEAGHVAICPHLNTACFEEDCQVPNHRYLSGDLDILARCDGLILTLDWERSEGARAEKTFAEQHDIPVWVYPEIPPLHPSEISCPNQVQGFIAEVMRMYRTHLDKNVAYGSGNITLTGELGLVTRIGDKVSRLLTLNGFKTRVEYLGFSTPVQPKHESIDDTYLDLAVYGIIARLFRRGLWGR